MHGDVCVVEVPFAAVGVTLAAGDTGFVGESEEVGGGEECVAPDLRNCRMKK